MGCAQSKIENEETVYRCRERKQFMERAVTARNKFAAAHSAHSMSLKNTGAALHDFAQGESVVSSTTSATTSSIAASTVAGIAPPLPPHDNFLVPPPPLPASFAPTSPPLQRASTMPEFAIPRPVDVAKPSGDPIIEEDEGEADDESVYTLKRRNFAGSGRKGVSNSHPKNPRIIDDNKNEESEEDEEEQELVLNRRRSASNQNYDRRGDETKPPPPMPENKGLSQWDDFFSMENIPGPTLTDVDESRVEREEIERKMLDNSRRREIEYKTRSVEKAVVDEEEAVVEKVSGGLPPPVTAVAKVAKRGTQGVTVIETGGKMKKIGGGVTLLQVFVELDDCFLKASESAHEVSRMLEATKLHYHSNFADKRGNINHSERVMRAITWNRSFRGLANPNDGADDFDSEEDETHATVLDKMLAWEKKLYDETKAGEQMKLEYQKKVASLNKLKKRNSNTEALERAKASVSHLHTRYIVDMQSMDSTVSEINRLRDEQLYPKLVSLVDGMCTMWETMRTHHENQSNLVQSLRTVDISESLKETSDHHHSCTRQLGGVVQDWHTNFTELIAQQKEYIKSLSAWLKLNLVPIDTNLKEKISSPARPENPPVQILIQAWYDHLERIPDEPAKAAIHNFAATVETICQYQKEELEFRNMCADSRRDLAKKTRDFEIWYNKYMQRRSTADEMDPDRAHDKDLIVEKQVIVEGAKHRLEEDEEAYQRLCVQVREKSLVSLKSHLPELVRALLDFSLACSDMYRKLRAVARSKNSNGA